MQASGHAQVTTHVTVGGEKNEEEDVGDGGETVALRIHENTSSFMDEFFKEVGLICSVRNYWRQRVS